MTEVYVGRHRDDTDRPACTCPKMLKSISIPRLLVGCVPHHAACAMYLEQHDRLKIGSGGTR